MAALEKIMAAEEKVAGLQDRFPLLKVFSRRQSRSPSRERRSVAVFGASSRYCCSISIVAIVVMVVKKVVGRKALEDEIVVQDASAIEEIEDVEDLVDEAIGAEAEEDGEAS